MSGFVIWPILGFVGFKTKKLWPNLLVVITIAAALLLAVSVFNILTTNNPLIDDAERAFRLQPAHLLGNFLAKWLMAAIVASIGFGIGRLVARRTP